MASRSVLAVTCFAATLAISATSAAFAQQATVATPRDRVFRQLQASLSASDWVRAESLARRWSRAHRNSEQAALAFCAATPIGGDTPLLDIFTNLTARDEVSTRCVALLEEINAASETAAALRARNATLLQDPAVAFQAFLVRVPDERDIEPLRLIAAQAVARDDLELAWRAIDYARRARPNDPRLLEELGLLLFARGDAEAALGHFQGAEASSPGEPRLLTDIAAALVALGRYDEARPLLARIGTPLRVARMLLEAGHAREAAAQAQIAVDGSTDPSGRYSALLILGDAHRTSGNQAEARSAFEEALRLRPESRRAQDALQSLAP